MEFELIPTVKAQGLDASAQPTFGPVEIEGITNPSDQVQIRLTTPSNVTKVGDKFTVGIEVATGQSLSISEYQIVLLYDPQALTVVDQDTSTEGTQIKLVDTLFTVPQPIKDNNTASATTGMILIRATGDFPVPVNYKVAEIEFQSQKTGNTEIKTDTTTISGVRFRKGTTDLPYTPASLNVLVNETGAIECQIDADCPDGKVCLDDNTCGDPQVIECQTNDECENGEICQNNQCVPEPECTVNSDCPGNQICVQNECTAPIPVTGLAEDLAIGINIFGAVILIIFGLYLKRKSNAAKY